MLNLRRGLPPRCAQDSDEACMTVEKRLQYINDEMYVSCLRFLVAHSIIA